MDTTKKSSKKPKTRAKLYQLPAHFSHLERAGFCPICGNEFNPQKGVRYCAECIAFCDRERQRQAEELEDEEDDIDISPYEERLLDILDRGLDRMAKGGRYGK